MKENAAALKHGIRNPEMETETETEYGIRERRFQAVDLKKKNVSSDKNDKKKNINEQIRRVEETAGTAISRESILVKRLLIPLPAMDANCHRRAKRGQKRHWQKLVP